MKKRIFALVAAASVLCGCLTGCVPTGGAQNTSAPVQATLPPETTLPTETTLPPFTLDSIRVESFTDIPNEDGNYDTACYMVYYGIMDAPEGMFAPDDRITRVQAAEAFCRVTGGTMQAELTDPDAFLTRKGLALMLYETAKHLGYPTELSSDDAALEGYAAELEQVEDTVKTAMQWALKAGLLRKLVGHQLLPDAPVSRIQVAQTILGLKIMDPEDTLASEIFMALPDRQTDSKAVQNHDAIQAAVDAAAQKYGAAGVQVAVIENGTVTDTYAYGWATKDTDPMTADHKMRVASISKVIVGLAAQLLREEGTIGLDEDISQYWGVTVQSPKYPDIPITIRGMLTHCSAIINAGDDTSRKYDSVKAKLQGSGFSGGVPGDIGYWSYNNYAFAVLGMTLELAANRTLDDILTDKLYDTMDIDGAFGSGDLKNTDLLATLYRHDGSVARTVEDQKNLHSNPTPGSNGAYFAGGLTVSVKDLAKLIALLAADGKYEGVQLLQTESVAEMETYVESAVPGGSYQAHPMRYWPDLYGTQGIFFHTGSAYGVFNAATYDPVTGNGVVVLTTGASGAKDDYGIYKICAEINAEIYKAIQ